MRPGKSPRTRIIVIDPGHGGDRPNGGSTPNNATGPSGVEEKALTLSLGRLIAARLLDGSGRAYAAALGKRVTVRLTREDDSNPSLAERAAVAARHRADLFLSLHFNRGHGGERGTEAWINRKHDLPHRTIRAGTPEAIQEGPGDAGSRLRNVNHVDDAEFASAIAQAAFEAIRERDPGARLRSTHYRRQHHGEDYRPPEGVKMTALDVLRDGNLGPVGNQCRACLLQVEFLDHPAVDRLFTGPDGEAFQEYLAEAMAMRLLEIA